jgi:hypothetical protein
MLIAVYCFLGSIIPILILLLGWIAYRRNKPYFKKKKRGEKSPPLAFRETLIIVFFLLIGLGLLYSSIQATIALWKDDQLWHRLDHQGEIQTVPLTRVEVSADMRFPSYYAVYQYNSTTHVDKISRDLYNQLNGQASIKIMTNGSTSRPVGWMPEYDNLPRFLYGIGGGLILASVETLILLSWVYPIPKRKRGLPEG